ncbi:general secretion pathway protein GspK [Verrucomicrobiota bacterium]
MIVALWVVGLLSLLVTCFAFDAHVEARITSFYRKRRKAEYLARSGIEIAELLMNRSEQMQKDKSTDADVEEDEWHEQAKRLAEGLAVHAFKHKLGDGVISLDIVPEPARRNLNLLKHEDWEDILETGGIPEDMWPVLIDSVLDWIDRDSLERADGAETDDYYNQLERPYKAKNGYLDTVQELLLVRGFSRSILVGGAVEGEDEDEAGIAVTGIADLLTVYGDGKVNVNAASLRVLLSLPDVDEVIAGAIIEEREGWVDEQGKKEDSSFTTVNDLFARIPDLSPVLRRYVTTSSRIYRITSVAEVGGVRKKAWCIVRHANKKLTYLRWKEEEAPSSGRGTGRRPADDVAEGPHEPEDTDTTDTL